MRKRTPYILFFFIGLVALGILFRNRPGSFISARNNFRISDTAAVNRIEILSNDTIILTRDGHGWNLGGNAPASQVAVNNFLFAFSRMSVKGINNKPDIKGRFGVKIKIFEGRKKHFLRFYETTGIALMQKEGAVSFYAVEVSGFPGIKPADIINTDPDHWKDRTLINLRPEEIRGIQVLHPAIHENDFSIKIFNGQPVLFNGEGVELPEKETDKEKLNFYLSYFTGVFYDSVENSVLQPGQDPRWILMIEDTAGKKYELKIYPITTSTGTEMFHALVKFNNQEGYKLTRYMVLDLLLQDKRHFIK